MHGVIAVAEQTTELGEYIYDKPCHWYALLAESGSERKAVIWLKRRQMHPYWPRYMGQVKLNRHRRAPRWRSVLPGYLFLAIPLSTEANGPLIEKTPGVRKIMAKADGHWVELTTGHIGEIRRIESALNDSKIAAIEGIPFKVGQLVRVINNVYWQFSGPIIRIDDRKRIIIEIPIFGRVTKLALSVSEIEAI